MDENEEAVLRYVRQHFDPSKDRQVIDVVGLEYVITRTSEGFVVTNEEPGTLHKILGLIVVGMMEELGEYPQSSDPSMTRIELDLPGGEWNRWTFKR